MPRPRPFAGYPTLGSTHAWLEHGGTPTASPRVAAWVGGTTTTLFHGSAVV